MQGISLDVARDGTAEGVGRDMKNDEKDAPPSVSGAVPKKKRKRSPGSASANQKGESRYGVKLSGRRGF